MKSEIIKNYKIYKYLNIDYIVIIWICSTNIKYLLLLDDLLRYFILIKSINKKQFPVII